MKLLVVDDQEAVGTIIAQVVAQGGWESIYRSTSDGIGDLIRQEKIDVLLIDYFMTERLGIEAIEILRNEGLNLPILLFSGNTSAIDPARAAKLNVLSILDKPVSIPQLRMTLNQAKKMIAQQEATKPKSI